MAFTDLPDDPALLPVSDPAYTADFLDLVVSERDRYRGALALLLCDDEDRLLAPVVVGELPLDLTSAEREAALTSVLSAVDGAGSVLVAVARRGTLDVRPDDLAWRRAAMAVCAAGPRLLGLHVVTPEGSREVTPQAA